MRRITLTLLIATSLVIGNGMTAQATYIHHGERPCTGWQYDLTNPATRQERGRRLVACVFTKLGLAAEVSTAQYVADRESGFYPEAYNPSGCGGLFQMMLRYWPGRRAAYLPEWLFPRQRLVSWTNPLANAWVAARMVKAGGWQPWAT